MPGKVGQNRLRTERKGGGGRSLSKPLKAVIQLTEFIFISGHQVSTKSRREWKASLLAEGSTSVGRLPRGKTVIGTYAIWILKARVEKDLHRKRGSDVCQAGSRSEQGARRLF